MKWLFARLSEPSTHAAIAGATAALIPIVPLPYQPIAQMLALLFGGAGVIKKG